MRQAQLLAAVTYLLVASFVALVVFDTVTRHTFFYGSWSLYLTVSLAAAALILSFRTDIAATVFWLRRFGVYAAMLVILAFSIAALVGLLYPPPSDNWLSHLSSP